MHIQAAAPFDLPAIVPAPSYMLDHKEDENETATQPIAVELYLPRLHW